MTVASGIYPYNYPEPFPFRVYENGNLSGILNRIDPFIFKDLVTLPAISGAHLGSAWHSLLAQLRLFNRFSVNPTIKAYINPFYNINRTIREPDPSGFCFTAEQDIDEFRFSQAGNRYKPTNAISGVSQINHFGYISDLRTALQTLFNSMASEYDGSLTDFSISPKTKAKVAWDQYFILNDWLRSMFRDTPSGAVGDYNYLIADLSVSGAMYDVSWGEVFYNPYPRIAGKEIINITNNIIDQRFEAIPKGNTRLYARLNQFGPVFPPCQTLGGQTIEPTDLDKAILTDISNFAIALSGWAKSNDVQSIRLDGHILLSGIVNLSVIENINRIPDSENRALIDDELYTTLGTTNVITQSGTREFGRTVNKRTPNVGTNIQRFVATSIGYPSHSGEPLDVITGSKLLAPGQKIIDADHSTRVWFKLPNINATIQTPRFGKVENVKRLAVIVQGGKLDTSGILRHGIAPSGLLSIWPSPGAYLGGSGQGYHVMDKGIWLRHNVDSQGMVLVSPYNGARLAYHFAEVNPLVFERNTIMQYSNSIHFNGHFVREAFVTPQYKTYTYGVSWGQHNGGLADATAFGCHSNGYYHIFGTRTPATPIPLDDSNIIGGISVSNGIVQLVTDFSTFIADDYDAGFSTITHYGEAKAHGVWSIPELKNLGVGKSYVTGDSTTFTEDVNSNLPKFNPRHQNGTVFNIVIGVQQFFGRIPVGYSVPGYFMIMTWSPGAALTERTTGGVMVGRGVQTASESFGYLSAGGFPPLTREDLWDRAEAGLFGLGTQITPGTHPVSIANTLGGPIAQAIDYIKPDTQIMTFEAGSIEPQVDVEGIFDQTVGNIIQDNFTLGTVIGSIGSELVASVTSNFDNKNFGNRDAGGSERQLTYFTYIDNEIIAIARGNNKNSNFADKISIAPLNLSDNIGAFDEIRISTQNLDPGCDYDYIGEVASPDAKYWPQIVFTDIV